MYPNFKNISEENKAALKARIAESITYNQKIVKRKRLRTISWSMAAIFCICLGIAVVFEQQQKVVSPLEKFANTASTKSDAFEKEREVKLVLSGQQAITIADSTTIVYNATGDKINLKNKQIDQKNGTELQFNTVLVPYGKRAHLSLSDGTLVWLNSGSRLVYPTVFTAETREVFLEGEAVFDVAHNKEKPFFVKAANDYSVQVLGTLFDVSCYVNDNKISTALLRGKVRVTQTKKSLLGNTFLQKDILPGMIAVLDKKANKLTTISQDVTSLFSWRNGYYEFAKQPLPDVLEKLTRYYNISFEIKNNTHQNETYSGAFNLSEDIDKVIMTLETTTGLNFDYDVKTKRITIH